MDQKMHRYMQRIEKIISTPTKNASPIRPSRSPLRCRTNQLDKYLKYQLSAKIISNIMQKHHEQLTIHFFNLIRRAEYRQRERVYKFVAIERNQIKVDLAISAKILGSVLKELVKKRYIPFMQLLHIKATERDIFQPIEISQSKRKRAETFKYPKQLVLGRTMSRPQQNNNRKVSEWIDDHESSAGMSGYPLLQQNIKKLVLRSFLKTLKSKATRALQLSFIKIRSYSNIKKAADKIEKEKSSMLTQRERLYKSQTQKLKKELNELKEASKASKERQNSVASSRKSAETLVQNRHKIRGIAAVYHLQHKAKILSNIKLALVLLANTKKQQKYTFKQYNKSQGIFLLNKFHKNYLKKHYKHLEGFSRQKVQKQINCKELIAVLEKLTTKKQIIQEHYFWKQFTNIPTIEKSPVIARQNSNVDLPLSSMHQQQGSFQGRSSARDELASTAMDKIHFYSFVDKIFKLILIMSKLLIPMKEAFVKIDLYASYSYRIEQSFKAVTQNTLRSAFEQIKEYQPSQESSTPLNSLIEVVDRIKTQKMVQAFSHIKIMAKERGIKIEAVPFELGIIEITKQFITERNTYSQYSLDYWSSLKSNIFQQENIQSFEQSKKEKNKPRTTF